MKRQTFEEDKDAIKKKLFRIPKGIMILPTKAPEHPTDPNRIFRHCCSYKLK